MPKKKKVDNNTKEKRRLVEAEKAIMKTRFGTTYVLDAQPTAKAENDSLGRDRFSLPVAHIRRDLIKNGLFMLFVVVILIVLKVTNITF